MKMFMTTTLVALVALFQASLSLPTARSQVPPPCLALPDPGPCKGSFIKYFWDSKARQCKKFVYGGCGGIVPFDTYFQCKSAMCGPRPALSAARFDIAENTEW